jgi:hypothetical protein
MGIYLRTDHALVWYVVLPCGALEKSYRALRQAQRHLHIILARNQPVRRRQEILYDPDPADLALGIFNCSDLRELLAKASMAARGIHMAMKIRLMRPAALRAAMATLAVFAAFTTSPARADRCEDIANQLKQQIDGMKVGITAGNVIYLSHPQAKELSLGCANGRYYNELYAKSEGRKPKPEFVELVAGAAAIVFTLPKDDMHKGASRCLSQMGILRGDDVKLRYKRLDMNCTRTKSDASIAIQRPKEH